MDGLWLLTEAGPKAGGGFYVFRTGGKPGCVQAPHTFFDEGTGDLALAVFEQLQLSCLFTNTVHRKAVSSPGASADVAHEASSLFNAATLGLMDASDGPVFQLHGFGSSTAPSGVEAIVSEGRPAPAAESLAARFRSALQTELGGDVRLFDVDVKVLGATTNVQGEAVRAANRAFMHVELSAPTRKRLLKDPQPLLRALSKVMPR
jgi:hypothetical protein